MTIVLDGQSLTIEKLTAVARDRQPLEVAEQCWEKIDNCRAMLQKKIDAHEIMYGVNTGIGEFSEVVLNDDQVQKYQRFLVYSHAAGIGKPMPEEVVRGAMTSRINVHCHGHSGQRPVVTRTFVEMLNKGVTPVVCEKGSVGACGDLAPMAQMALVLIGEGEAFYKGKRLSGLEAMRQAGIQPITFEARDGLASINGSNMLTAMAALVVYDVERFLKISEIAAATTLECLKANMNPYDSRLHTERGFLGAVASAHNILKLTEGSQILAQKGKKVQDAYSMRSTPQVTGAARDAVAYARSQIEIELNGVGDNPVFIWEDNAADRNGRHGRLDDLGPLREKAQPAFEPGPVDRPAAFFIRGSRHALWPDAQPVHRGHAVRREPHSQPAGRQPVHPGRRRPGRLRLDGHEHLAQDAPDTRKRPGRAGHRADRRRPGARSARPSEARPGRRRRASRRPPARRASRRRSPAVR